VNTQHVVVFIAQSIRCQRQTQWTESKHCPPGNWLWQVTRWNNKLYSYARQL